MHCPFCSYIDTRVIDSRLTDTEVRRRRECPKCDKRFTTYEKAELELVVIKKDGRRESFNRDKIYNGMLKACNKLPIPESDVNAMADRVEQKVRNMEELEVKSSVIGRFVMKELLGSNKVAYLRFASVCKEFDDPKHFERELEMIR